MADLAPARPFVLEVDGQPVRGISRLEFTPEPPDRAAADERRTWDLALNEASARTLWVALEREATRQRWAARLWLRYPYRTRGAL